MCAQDSRVVSSSGAVGTVAVFHSASFKLEDGSQGTSRAGLFLVQLATLHQVTRI